MTTKTAAKPFGREVTAAPNIRMMPISELSLAIEAPKGHTLMVRDSGRGSPLTDAELKASIYAKGIIVPLIWKQIEGRYFVVAGNRRLKLLREIFVDAPASLVPTQDVDDFGGDWREVAIDSNLSLPPHIVERFELIVSIAKDMKLKPEDVQARFGMTPRQYNQVMALGKMSENIRQLWKDGEIDARTAQVITLEPDPKEQDRIYAKVKKNAWKGRVEADAVRREIVPTGQREAGKLVAFVGVGTARKAKLIKQEDMFETSHTVTDMKALTKLADAKLAETCKQLVADGWSWAVREDAIEGRPHEYGTIEPKKITPEPAETKRLEELELLLNDNNLQFDDEEKYGDERTMISEAIKARAFTPDQRKKSGCFVQIGRGGDLVIEYGRVKPAEKKKVAATERSTAKKPAKAKKPGVVQLTNALAERLSQQLEKGIAASLHATPHVTVCALIAAFGSTGHIMDVSIAGEGRTSYGKKSSDKNFIQLFEGAMKSTPEARVMMLCSIAAPALSIQVSHADTKAPIDDPGLQALVAKMDGKFLNNAIASEFDAKNYFDSVSRDACVDAVRACFGDGPAAQVAKMKKGAAAKYAVDHVTKEGWLPRELRTVHYEGPTEKAAPAKAKPIKSVALAKDRTKKPAKKAAKKKAKK